MKWFQISWSCRKRVLPNHRTKTTPLSYCQPLLLMWKVPAIYFQMTSIIFNAVYWYHYGKCSNPPCSSLNIIIESQVTTGLGVRNHYGGTEWSPGYPSKSSPPSALVRYPASLTRPEIVVTRLYGGTDRCLGSRYELVGGGCVVDVVSIQNYGTSLTIYGLDIRTGGGDVTSVVGEEQIR